MKKLFLILAATLAMVLPQFAQAVDIEGMYVGGLGGVNFLNEQHDHVKVNYRVGPFGGLLAGYRWCSGIRAEAEIDYRYNKARSVHVRGGHSHHIGGHTHTWSFMANGLYEIDMCWCITPYLGAGIGYDLSDSKVCQKHDRKHKNGFAYQVIAGGLYPIDDCVEIGLEYRFHQKTQRRTLYNNGIDVRLNYFF